MICKICSKEFSPKYNKVSGKRKQIYCSVKCRYKGYNYTYTKEWRKVNSNVTKRYQVEYSRKRKLLVFNNYGGAICKCCKETTMEFLTIDHINNDGAKHRKELKLCGSGVYQWLKNNNYPQGFQVLCMNCNFAKGHFGKCPHEVQRCVLV